MKKQTAVEWFIEKLPLIQQEGLRDEIEQAKEMEKHQIKDAHLIGLITSMEMESTKQAEQYYNETFGK